jgi:hypothetical protein
VFSIWAQGRLTTFPDTERQPAVGRGPLPLGGSLCCGSRMALRHLSEVDIPWESGDRVLEGQAETDWLWNRSVQYAEEVENDGTRDLFPSRGIHA